MTTLLDEAVRALRNCLRVIDYEGALDADPQRVAIEAHAVLARADAQKDEAHGSCEWKQYRRSKIAELRPYVDGEMLSDRVSISAADKDAGSPKQGDMIARNPKNHDDQWLVAADYFAENFEPLEAVAPMLARVPDGFKFTRHNDGDILVTHKDGSGVVVNASYDPKTGIAGVVLYKLVNAMLLAAAREGEKK